jgi:hypothetical protein
MSPPRRALVFRLSIVLGALLLHSALGAYLAEHRVVAGILAAGPHTSLLTLLLAVVFVLLRLFVLLLLPGIVLVWLGALLLKAARGPADLGATPPSRGPRAR